MIKMKKITKILCLILMVVMATALNGTQNSKAVASQKTNPFKVASVQFNPQLNERNQNIEGLMKVVTKAAENGAKLIVTPEMATTGYYYADRKSIAPFTDTIPGVTTRKFEEIAKKYNAYIVIGMPEVDSKTDIYYDAAALVGPEGYIGKYRKTHQWETEAHWAAPGNLGVPVYDTKLGKIAINICMDSAYFESARLAAVNGANILAFPTNSSAQSISALQARAVQNGLYVVSANRSNTENGFHMIGASAVWSPEGKKLVEAAFAPSGQDIDEPTIIYADIDPANYDNKGKRRLQERRPELYKELVLNIAPWDYTKNTTSHDITAAALQYEPSIGDKVANMDKIKKLISKAAANKKLDLVVLPELSTTGPVKDVEKIKQLAETTDEATVSTFREIAKENKLNIIFGMVEKEGEKLYNSSILIDAKGEVVGKYRKTHLNETDKLWAQKGDKIQVFSTELGKVGMMIGDDAVFPEVAGVMSVERADIIAIPSSWNGQFGGPIAINPDISANKYPEASMCIWDSIAMSAQAYTVVSNYIGTEDNYLGTSSLYTLDPLYGLDQPVAASKDKEEVLVADFSTLQSAWWFNQEKLILSRRTHFYEPLIK